MQRLYTICRFFVAFVVLFYGFAKLNGAQFTILESELDKPLREVSGFWLTWYYFGYSALYGGFVAAVQIIPAIMLLFRKTTLLGSAILFGVIGNIILIDVAYSINLGATLVATVLEVCLGFLLWQHRKEIADLFWNRPNSILGAVDDGRLQQIGKYAVRALVIVVPFVFTWYIANYNNRLPTPIDGRWEVVRVESDSLAVDMPSHLYFERNRAYMSVFAYADSMATHHFEVDEDERALVIWEADRVTLRASPVGLTRSSTFSRWIELPARSLSVMSKLVPFWLTCSCLM